MNITLIGMAGVGKSSIGRQLAEKLNYDFIDSDEIIKDRARLTLQELIDRKGERSFLELEQQVINHLGPIENTVICPGGSVIYSDKAMGFLQKHSVIVFLEADISEIKGHLDDIGQRGIIGLKQHSLAEVYSQRLPLYEKYSKIKVKLEPSLNIKGQAQQIIDAVFNRS